MNKNDLKRKLTSRKLWIAVAGLVSGLVIAFGGGEGAAATVSGVILQAASVIGYLFAEGLTDAQRNSEDSPNSNNNPTDRDNM